MSNSTRGVGPKVPAGAKATEGRRAPSHAPAGEAGAADSPANVTDSSKPQVVTFRADDFQTTPSGANGRSNEVTRVKTRAEFDALFREAGANAGGAPTEAKFIIDRKTGTLYLLPKHIQFHYDFYKQVLGGTLSESQFGNVAYDRRDDDPQRLFICGTLTAYDNYVDPETQQKGKICYSLWSTEQFTPKILGEMQEGLRGALEFLKPEERLAFRPGSARQRRLLAREDFKPGLEKYGIESKTNIELSEGLDYLCLSRGEGLGKLVIVEPGAALPPVDRMDAVLVLGDLPPDAPPVAAMMTPYVQSYNSHLGIKYRQTRTPFFYKDFSEAEIAQLRKLNGRYIRVDTLGKTAKWELTTEAEALAHFEKLRPVERTRLKPNLQIDEVIAFRDAAARLRDGLGRWNKELLHAYGRKGMGVVNLWRMAQRGELNVSKPGQPKVVTPPDGFLIPANWYTRFMKETADPAEPSQTLSARVRKLAADPRFDDKTWRAEQLERLRADIREAQVPETLAKDVEQQLVRPYLERFPGLGRMRLRSSAAVVEDSGSRSKLPNMAGAFDSNTARWATVEGDLEATVANAMEDVLDELREEYASTWNERAISELHFHRVDLDEESLVLSLLAHPNQDDEKANGVLRVNRETGGYFSITGEIQFGEALVTNPEAGAVPATFVDGNYDVLGGQMQQSIEYERLSNLTPNPPDPERPNPFTDAEIHVAYEAMRRIRDNFARLEGVYAEQYINETEVDITDMGEVMFKQERPWLD